MSELFHTIRCIVQLPSGEDKQITVDIPGGLGPSETLKFWADLEDEWDAANIEIAGQNDKRLWWRT